MKPTCRGVAASLIACALLALLPACGTTRHMYEPAPHYVTVVEADGTSYSMRADEAGVAVVERAAFGDLAAGVALLVYVMIGMLTLLAIGAAALLDHALGQGRRNDPHHDPYRN